MWTKNNDAIDKLELHNACMKLLTCLIPTPLHPATMIELCMNFERGCEQVEKRCAY